MDPSDHAIECVCVNMWFTMNMFTHILFWRSISKKAFEDSLIHSSGHDDDGDDGDDDHQAHA